MATSSIYFVFCLNILLCSGQQITNKLCIDSTNTDACAQIARDGDIECNLVKSKIDCLINADLNLPQISVVTAEEALVAAPLVSDNIRVIGEVNGLHLPYQTVVLMRKTFSSDFTNLRGLRYCHPGYKHDEKVTKHVLEELDHKVSSIDCTGNDSSVEREIRKLAGFFGPSCRPGPWTQNETLDKILQFNYPSLCELCAGKSCNSAYQKPFEDSLGCLTRQGGDIALTTANSAKIFFNSTENQNNFQYLCSNGSVTSASNPCFWTKQFPRILVTSSNSFNYMYNYIKKNLPSKTNTISLQSNKPEIREQMLINILGILFFEKITLVDQANPVSLKSYVEGYRKIPEENTYCGSSVKWSTKNSTEQEKCVWARQAAINLGLQNTIDCVQVKEENDAISQLGSVQSGSSDFLYIDASFGYLSREKGLVGIAYPETDYKQLTKVLVLVRNDTTTENIGGLKDLQGKNGCFPEYAGKEWLSFIDTLRTEKLVEPNDYHKIFEGFVGQSCVPGAINTIYPLPDSAREKLCFNCIPVSNTETAHYCAADEKNKYYGSDGALKCLQEQAGYFAVISENDLTVSQTDLKSVKALCQNGSLAAYSGLNVDEDCYLDIFIAGEIVMKKDNPKIPDVKLLLMDIEYYLGQNLHKPFRVFDSFNGTKDLLFPDSTPGLTFEGTNNKYVTNYVNMLKASEEYVVPPVDGGSVITISLLLCMMLAMVTQIF